MNTTTAPSWRDVIKVHPAANLFPPMSPDELKVLGEDIKKNGLTNLVSMIEGPDDEPILLDGCNRLNAMELVGLDIVLENVAVLASCRKHGPGFDPYAYVISANIHRRHPTAEQKRELIAKLIKQTPGKSDRRIADQTKTSPTTVGKVRADLEKKGDVSKLDTRTDKRGRNQPAVKPVPTTKSEPLRSPLAPSLGGVGTSGPPKTATTLNSLSWSDASIEQRRKFIDAVGVKSIITVIEVKALWGAMTDDQRTELVTYILAQRKAGTLDVAADAGAAP
jgi:hypothetical protein